MSALRIDAAGYQTKIIEYCDTEGIEYAIAAKAVRTGRQLLVKMRENHRKFLEHSASKITNLALTIRRATVFE